MAKKKQMHNQKLIIFSSLQTANILFDIGMKILCSSSVDDGDDEETKKMRAKEMAREKRAKRSEKMLQMR